MKDPNKILIIVTDNPDVIVSMKQNKSDGDGTFVFEQAATLADAFLKVQEKAFHAVISDYCLKDGLCTDLLPALNNTPLIVLVNEGDEDNMLITLNAGAFICIVKDLKKNYLKLLSFVVNRSIQKLTQQAELARYRTQLEHIVEERTSKLIEMNNKLQESELNFRNVFQSASDGLVITDFNLRFIEANESLYKHFGVTREFLTTHDITSFITPAVKLTVEERLASIRKGMPPGNIEIEIRSPISNKTLPYEICSVPIIFNQEDAVLTIIRDLTERKFLTRKVFETIIQTEEQERSRIARDLHDEIGPLISALKIYTTSFIECANSEKKDKLAEQIGNIIRELIDSIKSISNDMSPHVLENFGLSSAIQGIINLFSKDIMIHLYSNLEGMRFPTTVESVIYRIFKELINNTIKHAKANNIYLNMDYLDSVLVCNYRDDGIGFKWPQEVKSQNKGMGINNITTRIKSLGGEYEIHTEKGQGFEINFALITSLAIANDQ